MASRKRIRVFLSYARLDGTDLAQRFNADLGSEDCDVWLDTARIAAGATWTTDIEQAVDSCQVVLALLTPGSYRSEICRAEQLRALRQGKRVIPVLAQRHSDIPLHLETKNYRDFSDRNTYGTHLKKLIEDIRNPQSGVRLKEEFRETYVTAPPLPRNYVKRPDALLSLRTALIGDGGGPSIALTAFRGMGGVGKTVLAQALCHDEVVQQAFPDGIVWVPVGKESAYDLVTCMREVARALKDDPAAYDNELACKNRYRTMVRDKAALIILDDVWRAADIEPFRAESPRSRILFTTRDSSIAAAVGAQEHFAELLRPEQAQDVLARWSGTNTADLPPEAPELIRECGWLPLSLSMVGAMLRGKPLEYWRHVLALLRNAELSRIKTDLSDYAHKDLLRAVQISVDALDEEGRNRYLALAVLLEDMVIDTVLQQILWNTNRMDALVTAEHFVSLSLAQREGGSIRLHDLQLDYIRGQFPDKEALGLIHGAVRLSSATVEADPGQFSSQMVGRLLQYEMKPEVRRFTSSLALATRGPWLRPYRAALHPPGTGLLRTLVGHTAPVAGVAVTTDGRRAVSASEDQTLKLWNLESGREVCTFSGHSHKVAGVAVTIDGRRAVSASWDHTLKVWDLESGREVRTLEGHSGFVAGVAVTADGRRAVSASWDKTLKVWDLENGREVCTLAGHSSGVTGVAVTTDGGRAVSASDDHTLKVWDLESRLEVRTLEGHTDRVTGVAVTTDGRRAVSASWDKTLKLWDLENGRGVHTLEGHSNRVAGVAVTTDGRRAVSASHDETLKVWDLESGREVRALEGQSDIVTSVAVASDGRRAVSASHDETLKVWDLESVSEVRTLAAHSGSVADVAVAAGGRRAVSASYDQTLKVWDLESGREVCTFEGHLKAVEAVAVTADGRAVSASHDQTLKVWDLETGREVRTLYSRDVKDVAVTADGRRAVFASEDHTLKVWDLKRGREVQTLEGHSDWVIGVAVTMDGRRAVSASWDKTLKVWDLESGDEVFTLEGHSDRLTGIDVTADGRRAVSASEDQTLKVWDLERGREIRSLQGHSGIVTGVAVTADGRRAVSASEDKTLKMWDLESGTVLATFTCEHAPECCAFATDRTIVAGDARGQLHLLSLEFGADHVKSSPQ